MGAPRSRLAIRDLTVEVAFRTVRMHGAALCLFRRRLAARRISMDCSRVERLRDDLCHRCEHHSGLRQIAEALSAIRAEHGIAAKIQPIINRCEFGMLGGVVRNDHVTRILADEKPMFVRETSRALECLNVGTSITLTNPSDKAVKDISALVEFICEWVNRRRQGRNSRIPRVFGNRVARHIN